MAYNIQTGETRWEKEDRECRERLTADDLRYCLSLEDANKLSREIPDSWIEPSRFNPGFFTVMQSVECVNCCNRKDGKCLKLEKQNR